jgi:hypothetical protein
MIEEICTRIIKELGATGLLVIGLYYIIYKPLNKVAKHVEKINHEGDEIIKLLKDLLRLWNGKS